MFLDKKKSRFLSSGQGNASFTFYFINFVLHVTKKNYSKKRRMLPRYIRPRFQWNGIVYNNLELENFTINSRPVLFLLYKVARNNFLRNLSVAFFRKQYIRLKCDKNTPVGVSFIVKFQIIPYILSFSRKRISKTII